MRSNPALSGTGFGPLSHRIDQVLGEKKNRLEQGFQFQFLFFLAFGEMHPRTPQKKSLSHCTVQIYKKVSFYSWDFSFFFQIGSFLFVFWGSDGSIGTVFGRKMATRPKKADEKGGKLSIFLFVFLKRRSEKFYWINFFSSFF